MSPAIPLVPPAPTYYSLPLLTLGFLISSYPSLIKYYADIDESTDKLDFLAQPEVNIIEEFDFIIIGAGSAGGLLLNRLSKDPKLTVLVLEAGGDPNVFTNVPGLNEDNFYQPSIDYAYPIVRQEKSCLFESEKRCTVNRGKGLGGTSNIYSMSVVRGNPRDYDNWANLTKDSIWSYENSLEIFKRHEDYHGWYNNDNGTFHGQGGEVYISQQQPSELLDYFYKAAEEKQFDLIDVNGDQRVGYGHLDLNIKNGRRWGSYQSFIQPVLKRANLKIYRYAKATKIHINSQKRGIGVTYIRHGVEKYVKSKREIILSAGSIDTSKLLMLSGIGKSEELESLGIETILDLPVGENLEDHVGVNLEFTLNRNLSFIAERDLGLGVVEDYIRNGGGPLASPYFNPRAIAYTSSPNYSTNWPDIEFLPRGLRIKGYNGTGPENRLIVNVLLMRPQSTGTVKLKSKDPNDIPLIDPKFFEKEEDMERLLYGIRVVLDLVETTPSFKSLNATIYPSSPIPACAAEIFKSADYWECFTRQMTFTLCHPSGTARMGFGPGDQRAVVDSRLRVIGSTGLRVIDASVFPKITAGHLHIPVLMVAERGAEFLLKENE